MQCPDCLSEKKVYCHRCDNLGRIEKMSNELWELLMTMPDPDISEVQLFSCVDDKAIERMAEQGEHDLVED